MGPEVFFNPNSHLCALDGVVLVFYGQVSGNLTCH